MQVSSPDEKSSSEGARFPWGLLPFAVLYFWLSRGREIEGRWDFIFRTFGVLGTLVLLGIVAVSARKWLWPLATVAAITIFEFSIGAYSVLRDIVAGSVAVGFLFAIPRSTRRILGRPHLVMPLFYRYAAPTCLSALISFWFGVYTADFIGWKLYSPPPPRAFPKQEPFAITLSGGGFRAALFHAGVLDALDSMGMAPRALCTVSGGSIIGAFYAKGGLPRDFLKMVKEGRFNLKRELLAPWTLARLVASARVPGTHIGWLPVADYTRGNVLADLLDHVFLKNMAITNAPSPGAPELMICATDLISGDLVGCHRGGVILLGQHGTNWQSGFLNGEMFQATDDSGLGVDFLHGGEVFGRQRLSWFVAASGAFPVAFPAFRLQSEAWTTRHNLVLADGGLTDNQGLALLNRIVELRKTIRKPVLIESGKENPTNKDPAWNALWLRVKEARTAQHQFEASLMGWSVSAAVASDGSAITLRNNPKSGFHELSAALDSMYRSMGMIKGSTNAIPTILIAPSVLIRKSITKADLTKMRDGDFSGRDGLAIDLLDILDGKKHADSVHDKLERAFRKMGHPMVERPKQSRFAVNLEDLAYLLGQVTQKHRARGEELVLLAGDPAELRKAYDAGRFKKTLSEGIDPVLRGHADAISERKDDYARWHLQAEIEDMLTKQLLDDFAVFAQTPTLTDRFSASDAEALFRLGQFLARLNRTYLRDLIHPTKD